MYVPIESNRCCNTPSFSVAIITSFLTSALLQLLRVEEPWTLELDDALANSFIAPATDRSEDDKQLTCLSLWLLFLSPAFWRLLGNGWKQMLRAALGHILCTSGAALTLVLSSPTLLLRDCWIVLCESFFCSFVSSFDTRGTHRWFSPHQFLRICWAQKRHTCVKTCDEACWLCENGCHCSFGVWADVGSKWGAWVEWHGHCRCWRGLCWLAMGFFFFLSSNPEKSEVYVQG